LAVAVSCASEAPSVPPPPIAAATAPGGGEAGTRGWVQHELRGDETGENFGVSVAISGNTLVVGAHQSTTAGTNTGAAYVFTFEDGQWRRTKKLVPQDQSPHANFGYSVAISGDLVVVGSPARDGNTGAAYVFARDDAGSWTQGEPLVADDGDAGARFGTSVAV